jgi:translation initiation factor 2B subunit (eIF-2B alpha/beta/delta family)
MDSPMTLALHEEFAKRMQDEHDRQNHRISKLEKEFDQNNKLLVSVEKLALSMENMQRELKNQSDRLDEIEGRDGEMWRKVVGYAVTAVIGAVIGFIFTQIGM